MSALLTHELIASAIEQSPIQGRIMLKLLLLQHFDITPEEINHIAADRLTRAAWLARSRFIKLSNKTRCVM